MPMFDIHSHLLPGIDDGARNMEEALALARACVADGIGHVVATPHVYPGLYDNENSNIAIVFADFRQALTAAGIPLEVSFGGEVRLSPEVMPLIEEGKVPFLGEYEGYRTMLLEFPDGQVPVGAEQFVGWLLGQNIRPVIVHPERNRGFMEHPARMRSFVEAGCLSQVTAGSLLGQFGSRARATAEVLLEQGWVAVIASDAHNLRSRAPMMRNARKYLAARYGRAAALELTQHVPAALCGVSPGPDDEWAEA